MAILELVLEAEYFGQQCINRFHYVSAGDPAAVTRSFALVSGFGAIWDNTLLPPSYPFPTVFSGIRDALSDEVIFKQITAQNLYDPFDFYETPFVPEPVGEQGSEAMSPTQAFGFRSSRTRTDIRRGMKRFVGVTEGNVSGGGMIVQGFLDTQLAQLASWLGYVIPYNDEGASLTFTPCILGKERIVETVNGEERVVYRKYETELEQLEHIASGIAWSPYAQTRTQNSRQYGRGR